MPAALHPPTDHPRKMSSCAASKVTGHDKQAARRVWASDGHITYSSIVISGALEGTIFASYCATLGAYLRSGQHKLDPAHQENVADPELHRTPVFIVGTVQSRSTIIYSILAMHREQILALIKLVSRFPSIAASVQIGRLPGADGHCQRQLLPKSAEPNQANWRCVRNCFAESLHQKDS